MNRISIKQRFEANGQSISDWAHEKGYNPRTVYQVMSGRLKGKRGITHKIAVDLGLKKSPESAA